MDDNKSEKLDLVDVTILKVVQPNKFWVHKSALVGSNEVHQLMSLSSGLQARFGYYEIWESRTNRLPQSGQYVAVYNTRTKHWDRGRVDAIIITSCGEKVSVFLVDYASTITARLNNIRELPTEALELPFQALCLILPNVHPLRLRTETTDDIRVVPRPGSEWDEASREFVRSLYKDHTMAKMEVLGVVSDVELHVRLHLFVDSVWICVNDELVEMKYAVAGDTPVGSLLFQPQQTDNATAQTPWFTSSHSSDSEDSVVSAAATAALLEKRKEWKAMHEKLNLKLKEVQEIREEEEQRQHNATPPQPRGRGKVIAQLLQSFRGQSQLQLGSSSQEKTETASPVIRQQLEHSITTASTRPPPPTTPTVIRDNLVMVKRLEFEQSVKAPVVRLPATTPPGAAFVDNPGANNSPSKASPGSIKSHGSSPDHLDLKKRKACLEMIQDVTSRSGRGQHVSPPKTHNEVEQSKTVVSQVNASPAPKVGTIPSDATHHVEGSPPNKENTRPNSAEAKKAGGRVVDRLSILQACLRKSNSFANDSNAVAEEATVAVVEERGCVNGAGTRVDGAEDPGLGASETGNVLQPR